MPSQTVTLVKRKCWFKDTKTYEAINIIFVWLLQNCFEFKEVTAIAGESILNALNHLRKNEEYLDADNGCDGFLGQRILVALICVINPGLFYHLPIHVFLILLIEPSPKIFTFVLG
jgi:hypothetical protein